MKKEWFVLQTLTGKENKVRDSILARTKLEGMQDYIGTCQIPTEKVSETKDGKKRTMTKKVFPGYVLVEMALYEDGGAIDKDTGARAVVPRTWQFLRETPGVIGTWLQQRPMPLRQSEVDAILSNKPADASARPRPKIEFTVGETVKMKEGAFLGQVGVVTVVDPDKGKLTVEVQIFGRKAPVDAEYWQVEKVSLDDMISMEPAS
ncbi:MAG: transcription termination/antitermination factor NusG [Kiritimatiellae bacterium]|nr:transcription termination/antitermination factor NusG [Kiritimatiellia bacterium]